MWYQHEAIVDRSRLSIEFATRRSTEAVLTGSNHHVDPSYVGKNLSALDNLPEKPCTLIKE